MKSKYYECFARKKRDNGEVFHYLVDDSATELKDLAHEIHDLFDSMPNDWIYHEILDAFFAFEMGGVDIDSVNIEHDIENYSLRKWIWDNSWASTLCDEYLQEFGGAHVDFFSLVGMGQWLARDKIYRAVWDFLESKQTKCEE